MRDILTGLLCLSAVLMTGAQGAGPAPLPDRGRSEFLTVNFADLNLRSTPGVQALYERLRSAARRVCGSADPRNLRAVEGVERCRAEALDEAVARINHPRLTVRHEGRDRTQEPVSFDLRPVAQR